MRVATDAIDVHVMSTAPGRFPLGQRPSQARAGARAWLCAPRWLVCGLSVVVLACVGSLLAAGVVFAAAPEAPQMLVSSEVRAATVVVHGVLSPGKEGEAGAFPGTYEFLYRESKSSCVGGSSTAPPEGIALGAGKEEVSQELSGLKAGTEYTVCLLERNEGTEATSLPLTFKTATPPQTPVTAGKAEEVTATTAKLEGTLNPTATAHAGFYFAYSNPGGSSCLEGPASTVEEAEGKALPEHATVESLEPHQKYVFCMVALNSAGETAAGSEVPFETEPSKPAIDSESVSGTNATSSTLEAQVNPNNQTTSFTFEYSTEGTTGPGGKLDGTVTKLSGESELPGEYGDQLATVPKLESLTSSKDYYYRVVATNATGTETGPVQLFTTVPAPTTDPANPVEASTATLNGHFALSGEPTSTQYSFTYNKGPACTGENAAAEPAITTTPVEAGTGTAGEEAKAATELKELTPHTEYTACLTTTNAFGSETGAPQSFTTLKAAPGVISESSSDVTDTTAVLNAEIDPGGAATTYHFQYGTTTGYGRETKESLSVGEDNTPHPAAATLTGLEPATEYHYRVVASNSTAPPAGVPGEDHTFITEGASTVAALPDDRAWEQVSPIDKHGARLESLEAEGGVIEAAADGGAISYVANSPTEEKPEGNPSADRSQLMSVRAPGGGWVSRDLATSTNSVDRLAIGQIGEYEAFSPDLSEAVVLPTGDTSQLFPGAPANSAFIRSGLLEASGAHYLSLGARNYVVASNNLQHVILGGSEWNKGQPVGEPPQPVTILPDNEPGPLAKIGDGGFNARNGVSEDGQRVFFEADIVPPGQANGDFHLFARDTAENKTVQLDLAQGVAEPTGRPGAKFEYATPDGERVYFKDTQRLTPDATAEPGSPELYEYNTVKEKLTDLTPNPAGPEHESTGVRGDVIGATDHGEYVYFVANGVLATGAAPGDCGGEGSASEVGECSLYVLHQAGGGSATSLIARLSGEADFHDWERNKGENLERQLGGVVSRMSPNGRFLSFMSDRSLTGYDNRDAASGALDQEVFEYDAVTGRLVCASCDPTGARPHGVLDQAGEGAGPLVDRPRIWDQHWLAASTPGWTDWNISSANYQTRFLSDEGRLFFDAADGLVPQDSNGKEDVYEFEPAGVGPAGAQCGAGVASASVVYRPERSYEAEGVSGAEPAGCVGLISSGKSTRESAFLDATEGGGEVFFLTSQPLSPGDLDDSADVYDARVCSSASPCASSSQTVPPPCTDAESCRAAESVPPGVFAASGTSTFSGPGNPAPAAPSKPVVLTRAQKLAVALKACRRDRSKRRRVACERLARRRYAAKKAARRATRKGR